jgi:hypothetical protein
MKKSDYTAYQKDVISRYYDNMDNIMLTRLSELVTELYLAKTQARKNQLWQRVHKAMQKLNIKKSIAEHIMNEKDVEILAMNLQDWLGEKKKK